MSDQEKTTGWNFHPRNIVVGGARVFFRVGYGRQPSGWHGPSGLFTTNELQALHWAKTMDALMRKAG